MRVVREIGLRVPADEVWRALAARDGRRGWYYGQAPAGEWRPGSRVEWRVEDGSLSEEWTLRELDPPRRLTAEGHWLFAPALASEPPHLLTWELEPTSEGCDVRLVADFELPGPASRLLESEGDAVLRGLRLEVDPSAQAELARREEIGEVVVRDLTPERLEDYLWFFDHEAFRDYPAWQGCYCMETHWGGSRDEWIGRTAADNRESMVQLIRQGQVTALLAYAGEAPAGWCNYGETTRLEGVLRRFDLKVPQQDGVGSLACFVIAAPYRRHGIARTLLEAACRRLAERGLRWAEAYPRRDPSSPQAAYRGPLDMYLQAGFKPHREAGQTLIVRKELGRSQ